MNFPIPIVTALLTIVGGAMTFVLGQVFIRVLLEPVAELKREIGRIAYSLDFYANQRHHATEEVQEETRRVFREHACRLRELANTVVGYRFWHITLGLPDAENIFLASAELIGHSNFPSEPDGSQSDRRSDICALLNIRRHDDVVTETAK